MHTAPESAGHGGASRARHGLVRAAVAALLALPLVGCADQAECAHGSSSVEDALRNFFTAAQRADVAGVQAQLIPGSTVTEADTALLGDALESVTVPDLFFTSTSEVPGWYRVSATDQDGHLVGLYEVSDISETEPGCFAVYWGTLPPETASPTSKPPD